MEDITSLLRSAEAGEEQAAAELLGLVYAELRHLAAQRMARESADHTLQPTALVHEAWLRLMGAEPSGFANRGHFFAAAAEAMRWILVDRARRKRALKHGGGWERVELTELEEPATAGEPLLLRVDEALGELEREDARAAALVRLRFFAGLSVAEAALALGTTERTARRDWRLARAWLRTALAQPAS